MSRYSLVVVVVALAASAGCKSAALRDDIVLDLSFSFAPTIRKPDKLHLPYVTGARVNIWLEDDNDADMTDWRFESSDPAVLEVTTRDTGIGTMRGAVVARAEGTATLRAFDTLGRLRYSHAIPVVAPDEVRLSPHGALILHARADDAKVDEVRVLEGGRATYLVRYFRGGRRLHGNGALVASASGGLVAEPRTTFLFENQEWLTVGAERAGPQALELRAGSSAPFRFAAVGVAESELARVVLEGEDEASARAGDWLSVVASGVDRAGRPVLGVDCSWTMNGERQSGGGWPWDEASGDVGDLFRYEYKGGAPKELVATRGTLRAEAFVHAGAGFVSSTNRLGCSAGGDDAAGLAAAVCVLLAALVVSRKRPVRGERRAPRSK